MQLNRDLEGELRVIAACLLIIAATALGVALSFMKPVLVPLVLAVLVSYLIIPLVDRCQMVFRVPRAIAVVLGLTIAGGIMAGVVLLISQSVIDIVEKAPTYEPKLRALTNDTIDWIQGMGIPVDVNELRGQLNEVPVTDLLVGILNSLMDSFSNFFLILVFVIYLVAGRAPNTKKTGFAKEMEDKIQSYLMVKVGVSFLTGVLVWLILTIIGLDLALVFGIISFLLNFIPNVGSIFATFLPLPMALIQFESMTPVVLCVAIPGAVQMFVGNVLEPKLMGASLNLHPITVLLALVFWGTLWGIPGMVLAAPVTAVIRIVLERISLTAPFAYLMAGQPMPSEGIEEAES